MENSDQEGPAEIKEIYKLYLKLDELIVGSTINTSMMALGMCITNLVMANYYHDEDKKNDNDTTKNKEAARSS